MPLLLPAVVALAGLATGPARLEPPSLRWRAAEAVEELSLRLYGGEESLGVTPSPAQGDDVPPPCIADVCQPRVEIPGYQQGFRRGHRTELVLGLLDRARLEPLSSIAWALAATGLRFDYTPPSLDASPGKSGGWGSVFVRVRGRLGADNVPVVPQRRPAQPVEGA